MDNWKQKVLRDLPLEGCTRSALKFSILASKVREREEDSFQKPCADLGRQYMPVLTQVPHSHMRN